MPAPVAPALQLRIPKGEPLTAVEMDNNFSSLRDYCVELASTLAEVEADVAAQIATAQAAFDAAIDAQSGDIWMYPSGIGSDVNIYTATNAYVVTMPSNPPHSYAAGLLIRFRATAGNTGAATLNLYDYSAVPIKLGAVAITNRSGGSLVAGDIVAGQIVEVVYTGSVFQLLTPVNTGVIPWGSTSDLYSFPTTGHAVAIAHNLGALPTKLRVVMVCITGGTAGYAENDEVEIYNCKAVDATGTAVWPVTVSADATNVTIAMHSVATFRIANKGGGISPDLYANTGITTFKLKAYASL